MFLLRRIRKRIKEIFAILAAVTVAFSVGGNDSQSEPLSETKGLILSTTRSETTSVVSESSGLVAETDTYIILADDMTFIKGKGASYSDGVVTVSKGGTYRFRGELKNGRIVVNLKDDNDEVKLKFYGVNVSSSTGAPVSVIKAPGKVVIYSADRMVNHFADTEERIYTYDENAGDSAVIFSKEDIVFDGGGLLRISADFNKGIFCEKDVTVDGAKINIVSFDDGIRSNETVRIKNSEVMIASGGDGIHTAESKLGKNGKVIVYDSELSYMGESDGVDSAGDGFFYGGEVDILVSGGSTGKHFRKSHSSILNGGNVPDKSKNDILSAGKATADSSTLEKIMGKKTEAAAVSVGGEAVFNDVNLKINSAYHGIVGENIDIENGIYSIASDGNGLYANKEASVDGAKVNIINCYNGIECYNAELSDVNVFINAYNEGITCENGKPELRDVTVEIKDKHNAMEQKP